MTYDVQSPAAARLLPYLPNWASGFGVRRSFKSDVGRSRSNKEQRRSLRNGSPRLSVEYRTVVSGNDFAAAKLFLRSWQNKPVIVPDFARWARTTAGSIIGLTSITINPVPAWAAEGQNLTLCGPDGLTERVLVASVAGTTVHLEDPLVNGWASGSVVRPTLFGLLASKISTTRRTRGGAEISISIECLPGGEPPREIGTAWATLGDREIFTPLPDYASGPLVSALFPVEQVDYGIGRTAQFRPVAEAQDLVEADFKGLDVTAAAQVEQFFDRMKGRRGAFYRPTGEKDFALAASAGSGATTMTVSGGDLATYFGSTDYAQVEEGIAVWLTDGTAIYRRITDIAASGGNSVITVNAAWGSAISAANLARISRMPLVRFGSDDMTMDWRTPLKAECRLSFQGIRA